MTYELKEPFWILAYQWQTLIAGTMALVAGFGTVWATISAARREIAAAQAQTKVAQEQIATTLRIEKRKNTQEAWALYVTLAAAMMLVLDDIAGARAVFNGATSRGNSPVAYQARQRIRKSCFPELRMGLLRLGGQLTAPFLSIDNKIDGFASQWMHEPYANGLQHRVGHHANLLIELDQIEIEAQSLCDEANAAVKRCADDLAAGA